MATFSRSFIPLALLFALGPWGCASTGGSPATVNGMDLAGVWRFDVVLEGSIRGEVTLTGDDRYVVRCIDDLNRPPPPSLLTRRAARLEFLACGAQFRVFRDESGVVRADVSRVIRETYRTRVCAQTRTAPNGAVTCVRYETVNRSRSRTVTARTVLVQSSPGVRPAAAPGRTAAARSRRK